MAMDDRQIISLYFARDERALSETERQYGRYCMTVSMNILAREQDAEECVNDTWLRAWNAIPPTNPTSLKAWLGRVVRNLSLTRLRARRNRDTELALDEFIECIPMREDQADELPALLDEFLGTLQPLDRKLFVGRYWYAHPVKQLAGLYGLTPNAATQRISALRDRLRTFLDERGYTV